MSEYFVYTLHFIPVSYTHLDVYKRQGLYRVGILDADLTGSSIPKMFGAEQYKPQGSEDGLFPVRTHSGILLMSINLLLDCLLYTS